MRTGAQAADRERPASSITRTAADPDARPRGWGRPGRREGADVAKANLEHPAPDAGLPFGVWWAIGEAAAVALLVPALRLLGVL